MNGTGNEQGSCAVAVPAELASGKWQPIETAPKDGTRLLGFRPGWAEAVGVVYWSPTWREWQSVPGSYQWKPTHWMPVPTLPETTP